MPKISKELLDAHIFIKNGPQPTDANDRIQKAEKEFVTLMGGLSLVIAMMSNSNEVTTKFVYSTFFFYKIYFRFFFFKKQNICLVLAMQLSKKF